MTNLYLSKKTQTEIVVTVLLVIIGLAAMAVLSGFVINLVKDKLKSGDCFKTFDGLSIVTDEGKSYFDAVHKRVVVTIERSDADFDLSAITVSVGNENETLAYVIDPLVSGSGVNMTYGGNISLPAKLEFRVYNISLPSRIIKVNRVKIVPTLLNGKSCLDGIIEAKI